LRTTAVPTSSAVALRLSTVRLNLIAALPNLPVSLILTFFFLL